MIVTRTPYRLSLFGGGSDYPQWFEEHGGAVLGGTIDKYCWLMVRPQPFHGTRYKVTYRKVEAVDTLDEIQHPAVREALRMLDIPDAEVHHSSDLPAYSGMGSSSAFVVGLLQALYALKKEHPEREQIAAEATHLERVLLRETVGCQDQVLCALGGLREVTFAAGQAPAGRPVHAMHHEAIHKLNQRLMLFYTGVPRRSSDIAGSYILELPTRLPVMRRIAAMVEDGKAALAADAVDEFGPLLHEAWQLKKTLGGQVTNGTLDGIYTWALNAGAIGGKVLGAGGGGFLLLFVPPGRQAAVKAALKGLICVPFSFEWEGSCIVTDDSSGR